MDNNRAKELVEQLGNLQVAGKAAALPCPRCGLDRMDENPTRNAFSRCAKVYICDVCGMDEALRDMAGMKPIPLEEWAMCQSFGQDSPTYAIIDGEGTSCAHCGAVFCKNCCEDGAFGDRECEEAAAPNSVSKRMVSDSHGTDSERNARSGLCVEVLQELTSKEGAPPDVGRMFRVGFPDGIEMAVFEDELSPAFQVGDKVKISHISYCNPHNHLVGTITELRNVLYYLHGDKNNPQWMTNGTISYDDGTTEFIGDMYRKGALLVAPVELVERSTQEDHRQDGVEMLVVLEDKDSTGAVLHVKNWNDSFKIIFDRAVEKWHKTDEEYYDFVLRYLKRMGYEVSHVDFQTLGTNLS